MTYYSRRNKELWIVVTDEFWGAFKAYIEEIFEKVWFPDFTFWKGDYEYGQWYVDEGKINSKMIQEIGKELYPLDKLEKKPGDNTIFDLIEFFFHFVVTPTGIVFAKKQKRARDEYSKTINQMFNNFRLKYELREGQVRGFHSELFNEVINKIDLEIPDKVTSKMIYQAIEKFSSRKIEEQKIGLEKLVDAYQRISSWEDQNKKKSVEKMLNKISKGDQAITQVLDEDTKELWKIANNFMIRHTEKGKIPINDPDCIEYLFYAYFNAIRFILKKYGYIKEKTEKEDEEGRLLF